MRDVVFAIPSYRRADRQLAVRWLSRLGYSPSEIFVAVQNDEDRAAYSDALRGVATVFGRNGVGVSFNRNQCLSVRPDARLVMVDDGVRGVSVKTPQGKCESVKTRERLDAMLSLMFDFAERNRVDVFSLNNSSSGLCATPYDFIDHPYVSIFMGMMNRRVQFDSRVRFLEDVERACRILRGGWRTYRFGYAFPACEHCADGGQHEFHADPRKDYAFKHYIATRYAERMSLNPPKKGHKGYWFTIDRNTYHRRTGVLFGKI